VISKQRLVRPALICAALATILTLAACGKGPGPKGQGAKGEAAAAADAPPLMLAQEDLLKVQSNALASGPSITGSIEPERRADLRAEVPAVVIAVLKENGEPVRRGDLLVRLDDTAIRDSLNSASASASAASQAFDQAERQYQRMTKLRETGVVSAQQLEDVEIQRNSAQSEREAARSRMVTARQQLERTEVRAPFDGIVSDRKVSAGDTAQVGKELVKVIDPKSMRFEGFVSADSIGEVKNGQRVTFRIHGFAERLFDGTIARVNPAANTTTRQVEVLVEFVDRAQQPAVAGLYAEGRVETNVTNALTLPASSIVRDGENTFAWQVKNGKLHKVKVNLGARDARSGEFALVAGVNAGDSVLRYPTSALKDGQRAETGNPAKAATVVAKDGASGTVEK
jgi:membrane fusion protein (multidrug efflux system)